MKMSIWAKVLLIVCTVIVTLSMLTQSVFAVECDGQAIHSQQNSAILLAADDDDDGGIFDAISNILDTITNLPKKIASKILDVFLDAIGEFTDLMMDGLTSWLVKKVLSGAETVFTFITDSSANVFNYDWFNIIVGVFHRFGVLLFAVGVALAFVDVGIEYRRRGADIGGAMLNLGKGLMAVGLFSTAPVPLYKFCVNIQSVIMKALSINWSFSSVNESLTKAFDTDTLLLAIMLVVIIVLMVIIYLDTLKRGGILLVQICIGSFYMISVPRGYMDSFYSWCKQIIALCITTLFQNLLMFCGLMVVPTNLFLGIGVMVAAKEVPRICGQFGLDTSVKASLTSMAVGANASVQAIKAAATLLA